MKNCWVVSLGKIQYPISLSWQRELICQHRQGLIPDILLLMEYPLTLAIGNIKKFNELLQDGEILRGAQFYKADQESDLILYSPGQLVCYQIFDRRGHDANLYLKKLQQALTISLRFLGIISSKANETGVWVGQKKIASIGAKSKGGSCHRFTININNELAAFKKIDPNNTNVTSVSKIIKYQIDLEDFEQLLTVNLSKVYNQRLDCIPSEELDLTKDVNQSLIFTQDNA